MFILLSLFFAVISLAIASSAHAETVDFSGNIDDLRVFPQNLREYLPDLHSNVSVISTEESLRLMKDYEESLYSPWGGGVETELHKNWGVQNVIGKCWGSNLLPLTCYIKDRLRADADMSSFPSMDRRAIVVRNTAARFLPLSEPVFNDPSTAGEGYPFDILQNSLYWAGTPVRVLHANLAGDWLLCDSGLVPGWVSIYDLAFMDDDSISQYKTGRYCSIVRDNVSVRSSDGDFFLKGEIGSVFPVRGMSSGGVIPLVIPMRAYDGSVVFVNGLVSEEDGVVMPLTPDLNSLAEIAERMVGNPYGWGGLYEGRDCSSTLKDLYAPFGVWLPRDSGPQSKMDGYVDLESLSPEEKLRAIAERAVPFRTIIGMTGHVVLFVGLWKGVPAVFHNTWGVRLLGETSDTSGRLILGRTIVSSLRPGQERSDVDPDWFLNRVKTMVQVI